MTVEVIKAEVATVSHQEEKMKVVDEVVEVVDELKKDVEEAKPESVEKSTSFKEESNFVSDLKDHEKKALSDLKAKLEEAILGNNLFKKDEPKVEEVVVENKEQVVEDFKEKEVEEKEQVEGEESSKKSGEKKGFNKFKSTIQEAFKGHGLFKKDEVKVEEVVEEKKEECGEEEKKEEEKKEECGEEEVVKVEEDIVVKEEGEKVQDKEKLVEVVEESSKKSVEKKGLNKLKSKIGEAFKGGLFKKDEPKVEEDNVKVEEEKKEDENKQEEKKEECAEQLVQEDVKEKESETVEEKEKVEQGEESSKKIVEKKGLNKFKSTIQEAFKGHLFSKKSKKEVEENKEECKPEGDDKVEEEPKLEGDDKVDVESKPECEDKVEEKKEEEVVEEIKTEVCEEKEPEGVVEEVAEDIKTQVCEEDKKLKEVVQVCEEETKVEDVVVDKDISLWGVPLLPSKADEGTDVVLLKFLRARDFKVNEAFEMLKKTLEWRKEWKIDSILDEDLGTDLSSAAYMSGVDREGHPICYNIFGVLDDEELYQKTLASEEKRDSFLRWRFQLMERGIHKLELKPTGVTSLLQINDLKNSPGPAKKEVRLAIKQALGLLQDNYPEFVARNIFINVPFWYYAYNAVFSTLLTQRTKSKLVFARPAKVTETLLKFIPVEEIPIQYGGLKRDSDFEFSAEDCIASELVIKATSTATIEIPAPQAGTTFIWDITVLGWDVNYKEEFVPTDECSYTIIVQKQKKLSSIEGPIRNTFRTTEPGKIVLTIDNCSNKKKKVFYRNKVKKCAI